MKRTLLLILISLFLVSVAQPASAARPQNPQLVLQLSQQINTYRAGINLYPLQISSVLSIAAQEQVTWMAQNETVTHSGRDGSTAQSRVQTAGWSGESAEIIYSGQGGTQAALNFWLSNAQDGALISTSYFNHIGLATASNNNVDYWVVVMGIKTGETAGSNVQIQPVQQVQPTQPPLPAATVALVQPPTQQPLPQPTLEQVLPTVAVQVIQVPTIAQQQSAQANVVAETGPPTAVPTFISQGVDGAVETSQQDTMMSRIMGAPLLLIAVGAFLIAVLILLYVWWSESRRLY